MRLALGTVQFGLAYGIAGRGQVVPEAEVRAILECAADDGVCCVDTASAYGDIEQRLGRLASGLPLDFVTKVPAIPADLTPANAATFALEAAARSLTRLGPALRSLMLHNGADLHGERGDHVASALRSWSARQGIRFGASCYAPEEAGALQRKHGIALTQLPGNALDQRVTDDNTNLRGLEIHLRSVFLQGLLLMPLADAIAKLPHARPALEQWHSSCRQHGNTALEMALAVAKSFSAVSYVVVGVDSLAQWREIAQAWRRVTAVSAPELNCLSPQITDPRLWNSAP